MNIAVIGTGYIGLVTGVCLADFGNKVNCVDVNKQKIGLLKKGGCPIYEPGLEELIKKNKAQKRLFFTTEMQEGIKDAEVIFIAVGTPGKKNGEPDLKYIKQASEEIGRNLDHEVVIINKSTVPIGTGDMVSELIGRFYKGKFEVVSNPEFLREGTAVKDFRQPDRIVIGIKSGKSKALKIIKKLYQRYKCPWIITDMASAEMIKYASNAFLAMEISFINSLADLCEKVGSNIVKVAEGMKADPRIGNKAFLRAGVGFGGSCLPKDVEALIQLGRQEKTRLILLEEIKKINLGQRRKIIQKLKKVYPSLKGKKIVVWGLAFKPNTDDTRESPALAIVEELCKEGAKVRVYDPVVKAGKVKLPKGVQFIDNLYGVCEGSEAVVVATDWAEFKKIDWERLKKVMKKTVVVDGRNIYNAEGLRKEGVNYLGMGQK